MFCSSNFARDEPTALSVLILKFINLAVSALWEPSSAALRSHSREDKANSRRRRDKNVLAFLNIGAGMPKTSIYWRLCLQMS